MNIINILYGKEYWFNVRSDYACKITHISFVIPLFVRSNNFNNNNIKSRIIRFRVLRSGEPTPDTDKESTPFRRDPQIMSRGRSTSKAGVMQRTLFRRLGPSQGSNFSATFKKYQGN